MQKKVIVVLSFSLIISFAMNLIVFFQKTKNVAFSNEKSIISESEIKSLPIKIEAKKNNAQDEEIKILKQKILELSNELTERGAKAEQESVARENNQRAPGGWDLSKMQQENPERYQQIVNRMREFNNTIKNEAEKRRDFLITLSDKKMSPEQSAQLKELKSKVEKIDELARQIEETEDSTEQRDLRRQMMQERFSTQDLMDTARNVALDSLAKDLGYSDTDKDKFTNYIEYIIQTTNPASPRGIFRLDRSENNNRRGQH